MKLSGESFKIRDYNKDCFKIEIRGDIQEGDAVVLRQEVERYLDSEYDVIYLDTRGVTKLGLSSINEVIHTHYILQRAEKKLIFLYEQGSEVAQWVDTTGLDKFVATAMVPAKTQS